MTTVVNGLQVALTLVKGGWIKGDFRKDKETGACFCADGALRQAFMGGIHWDQQQGPNRPLLNAARLLVAKAISPRGKKDAWATIIDFNDKSKTTKAQVVAGFQKAIVLAKKAA